MFDEKRKNFLIKNPTFCKTELNKYFTNDDRFKDLAEACEDLTYQAAQNQIEEIYERDKETERLIEVLLMLKLPNPVIIGEAGVGKTALAKNLAKKIVEGKVPKLLEGWKVMMTSFSKMWAVAGARAGSVDAWQKYHPLLQNIIEVCRNYPIILFIDELEQIIFYPVSRTAIMPALADGSLRLIGAMTERDYRKIIETEPTLNRRFQIIYLEELSSDSTFKVLCRLSDKIKQEYNISIPDIVLEEVIKLSDIYIHNQFRPGKAINVLERACAKALIKNSNQLESKHVKEVVSELTKIPFDIINTNVKFTEEGMINFLNQKVRGQKEIIEKIAKRLIITLTRSNIEPHRPNGVFLFAGPTGVGKTELAKALSIFLTGSEENMVRLDMSTYNTPSAAYALLGAERGPFGELEIPFLTNLIRSRPYTVLLLDEFEKAHYTIWNLFLQVFDYGRITDYEGNTIYFDNITIIMTTNVGYRQSGMISMVPAKDEQEQKNQVEQAIKKTFPPEFLSRIDEILIFNKLTDALMKEFVQQKVDMLKEKIGKEIILEEKAKDFLAKKGYDSVYGARVLNRTIDKYLGKLIAELKSNVNWDKIKKLHISLDDKNEYLKIEKVEEKNDSK